jgi:hypothetical protein
MDIGFRVFFLEEDGSLRNVPWPTYVGLYFEFPSVRFPEYAGKAVKCVHVVVELEDRSPVAVLESIFFITHFNLDGGIDQEKKVERQRLATGMRVSSPDKRDGKCVIDMRPRLSEKRYDHEFRWAPTTREAADLERRIEEALGI